MLDFRRLFSFKVRLDFKVIFNHALLSFNGMGKNQGVHYAR